MFFMKFFKIKYDKKNKDKFIVKNKYNQLLKSINIEIMIIV